VPRRQNRERSPTRRSAPSEAARRTYEVIFYSCQEARSLPSHLRSDSTPSYLLNQSRLGLTYQGLVQTGSSGLFNNHSMRKSYTRSRDINGERRWRAIAERTSGAVISFTLKSGRKKKSRFPNSLLGQLQGPRENLRLASLAVFRAVIGRTGAATQQGTAPWRPTSTRHDDRRRHSEDVGGTPAYRRSARRFMNVLASDVQSDAARHCAADRNGTATTRNLLPTSFACFTICTTSASSRDRSRPPP
jgi:hypothetical protein